MLARHAVIALASLAVVACTHAPKAEEIPTFHITATQEGYLPSPIVVEKDKPVKLVVTRTTEDTCATWLVVPGYGIEEKLPLNVPVEVTFTPNKSGELIYGCAMGQMVSGVILVK